jgi:hypothetical protein
MSWLEVRRWDREGEMWPDRRISIAEKDSGHCLFISCRYSTLDEAEEKAKLIVADAEAASCLRAELQEARAEIERLTADVKDNAHYRDEAVAHLDEIERLKALIPPGHVVVPEEPTNQMVIEGRFADLAGDVNKYEPPYADIYKAMIQASQGGETNG